MKKDDALYLIDMAEHARLVRDRVAGLRREQYDADLDKRLVPTYLVQIIGEAASRVSGPTRETLPDIPWPQIVGLRNRIVHDYLNIDANVLWEVATRDVPRLLEVLEVRVGGHIDQREGGTP